jgi:hypothetical protein
MAMSVTYTTVGGRALYENRGGAERYYSRDPLGNTVALIDGSGNVTNTFSYWPNGEIRSRTGSTATPFTFLGTLGYFLDYIAKFYVRARMLLPPTLVSIFGTTSSVAFGTYSEWPELTIYGHNPNDSQNVCE